jgi:cytochrome c oxidase subunit IV
MAHQQVDAHHDEHPPTTIRQYIYIGVLLAVITAVELYLTEGMELAFWPLVTLLIILSAAKFIIVVALFMHLRFDHPLFTRLFVFGMLLATAIMIALLALFNMDAGTQERIVAAPATAPAAPVAPMPTDPAAAPTDGDDDHLVGGVPASQVYAANCAACHGQNREGLVGGPLTPAVLTQSADVYHDVIKNGRPGTAMPPWGGVFSDDDIDVLVDFLKTVEP